jgi:hypothetical protein
VLFREKFFADAIEVLPLGVEFFEGEDGEPAISRRRTAGDLNVRNLAQAPIDFHRDYVKIRLTRFVGGNIFTPD